MFKSPISAIKFTNLTTDIQRLSLSFLRGANLKLALSGYIYKCFDKGNTFTYMQDVGLVRKMLDTAKKMLGQDVVYIKTRYELTDAQKHLAIRLINMAHTRSPKIIALNDDIIFRPESFHGYDDVAILMYVGKTITAFNKSRKQEVLKKKSQCRKVAQQTSKRMPAVGLVY